jgi:hypothetical protein
MEPTSSKTMDGRGVSASTSLLVSRSQGLNQPSRMEKSLEKIPMIAPSQLKRGLQAA